MNVPALRFKEFSDKWQVFNLEELSDVTTGNKDTQNRLDDGEFPFFVRSQTVEKINSYAYDGEAVLTSGDGVGVGKNFHYINGKFDYHQRVYCIFNFKSQVSGKYIFYYFSEKFNKRVMGLSAKNSVDSVRRSMITEMPISIPTLSEQTKIANFLTAIDEKITQLTKKHDLLNQYKKGVMQQIFSQELRFKDDDGGDFPEWEETALENCASFFRGGTLSKSDIDINGKFSCVHYGELFTTYNEIITTVKSKTNITNTFNSEFGDILMPSSDVTPAGLAKASCILKAGVVLGGDINVIRVKNTIAPTFLSYLLNFEKNKIIQLVSGTTVKHIYIKDIKSIELTIPTAIAEQTKIANFLTAIDDKITATQNQLQAVKQYKQGLLQQMFV